jgi:sucrose-phosphate synthase
MRNAGADMPGRDGLDLGLISIHGLIRGKDLELGRDADTGGQTKYVVELAQALGATPGVASVTLFTRLIQAPEVDADYGRASEPLGGCAKIVRIRCGPTDTYIPKEALWDHLDSFADNLLAYFHATGTTLDIIHSHYADAGYVGSRLAHVLGVPLIHTGHSLGRVKRRRLLATGLSSDRIGEIYNMPRRIEAEELTLAAASRVITSTRQEVDEQYSMYDHYQPQNMRVIPPGTDLTLFFPAAGDEWDTPIGQAIARFLAEPAKPLILALSRPDPRKNVTALIDAFGQSERLRSLANLAVVLGQRDDVSELDDGARTVLTDVLVGIDRYDLYGKVAYPKHHRSDDVPVIYRIAALSGGVFVNPALTEPFGLTLIEAAASGLPIVATEDGGPRDIIGNCDNGLLIDPLDRASIEGALLAMLENEEFREQKARNGTRGVREYYSWEAHANRYVGIIVAVLEKTEVVDRAPSSRRPQLYQDRAIFTDLDQNLLGDPGALPSFVELLRAHRQYVAFGIATGRRIDSALKVMKQYGLPEPDVLVTSGGTEIHYAPDLTEDAFWARHIDHAWTPHVVRRVLADLPGLTLQPRHEQSRFKLSYFYDPRIGPSIEDIQRLLRHEELSVNAIVSFGQFLDILPIRASKGLALRHVAGNWGIPLERILVAGGSGADEDMMRGNTLAVVVANRHHEELSHLADDERIYYAKKSHALGILEAVEHFDFFPGKVSQSEAGV